MPIRTRRPDNKHQEAQIAGYKGMLAVVLAILSAGYMK
jgi:hypothetical protein